MKRKFTFFLFASCILAVFASDPIAIREGNKIMGHIIEDGT